MPEIERHTAYLPVSTELLADNTPPWHELVDAALRGDLPPAPPRPDPPTPAGHTALLDATDGPLRAVVELHAPRWDCWWQCDGCDSEGYDAEPPHWPCRTVELIAEQLGVDLSEVDDA